MTTAPRPPARPSADLPELRPAGRSGGALLQRLRRRATVGARRPAPVAPGAAPVDLRQSVDASRGTLKRLQLLVPGFRAYRQGEDLRAADSLLRRQVADKIRAARATLENARSALTNAAQFRVLNDLPRCSRISSG
ncbi:hypothetical protein B1B_03350 [mine drainage metagenome]|uniref:Uncharacterized protein n=1 Tax=mine drainage metagenome TaxID=410659 RepID=T1CU75_9ZZZZ